MSIPQENAGKQKQYKIEIKKYKELSKDDADYVFLGAWNFKDEIFRKEKKYIKSGGKFITHIPTPKIL